MADRVYNAFENYLEGRARFPHAKKPKDHKSIVYPQSGYKLEEGRLQLSQVGRLRVFQHRPLQGTIKRLAIKHDTGEWCAILLTEQDAPEKPNIDHTPLDRIRGGDLGLERYLTLDDAESADYPEFLRKSEEKLKRLQRHLSRKQYGSRRHRLLAFQLARLHLHVARQRMNWQNQIVAELYKQADALVLERLSVAAMLQNHRLAKSIQDASWGSFARRCIHVADRLGQIVLFIDPWGYVTVLPQLSSMGSQDTGRQGAPLSSLRRTPIKRREQREADQEARHRLSVPAPGRGVVTRRAETNTNSLAARIGKQKP